MTKGKNGVYVKYFKRLFEKICSLLALTVFWWLYLIIAILVSVKLGSPVIFKQPRPGKNGTVFNLYKFRSMTDEKNSDGNLLPDEVRLTKFGKVLRSTSLDELPEVFNILKGDMSIIGPRPLLVRYLPFYTEEESHRHDVRPGLSGWAQVNGRNFITWEETFKLDVEYVNNVSFLFDMKIIIFSVIKFLKRSDITDATQGTQDSSGRKVHDALDIERGNINVK